MGTSSDLCTCEDSMTYAVYDLTDNTQDGYWNRTNGSGKVAVIQTVIPKISKRFTEIPFNRCINHINVIM